MSTTILKQRLRLNIGTYMSARHTVLYSFFLCVLFVSASPVAYAQRTSDAFKKVDEVLRYMRSANYSEDELIRRVAWNERLVGEIVNYKVTADDDRQNFLRFLDIAIVHYDEENIRLKILVRAITTLDPLVQKYFPQWIVQDESVILEVMRKLRDNRDDLNDAEAVEIVDRILTGKAKMRIVQSPKDRENVLGIIIEKARPKSANNEESSGYIDNMEDPSYQDYRVVGKKNIESVLQSDLYPYLIDREKYAHVMETGVIKPSPYLTEAKMSIPFGGGFMWTLSADEVKQEGVGAIAISRIRAGFDLSLGNDWVNLPFLYGAQWNLHFVYEPDQTEYIKLGPSIPFGWGDIQIESDFPLFKHRKLNGTLGLSGEYFKQLTNIGGTSDEDASGVGAAAFVSFGLKTFGTKKITDLNGTIINGTNVTSDTSARKNTFYHIAYTANAHYWRDLGFLVQGLRVSVGAGFQKVIGSSRKDFFKQNQPGSNRSSIADSIQVVSDKAVLEPYLRLQYDSRGKTLYGAALQYFNGGLMGELYFHIFSWLRAEVKYARVVFRDAEKWEYDEIIVPGLRMGFNF